MSISTDLTVAKLRECLERATRLAATMSDEQLAAPGYPGTPLLHELYRCLEAHPGHWRAAQAAMRRANRREAEQKLDELQARIDLLEALLEPIAVQGELSALIIHNARLALYGSPEVPGSEQAREAAVAAARKKWRTFASQNSTP